MSGKLYGRSSIIAMAAQIFALGALSVLVASCKPAPIDDVDNDLVGAEGNNAVSAVLPRPEVKTPLGVIGRPELLSAFARAADAVAAGRSLPEINKALVGRHFILRLPFGCQGPEDYDATQWAGWSYDKKAGVLRLNARPERWSEALWVKELAADKSYETVEGFWVDRPWTSSEDCPATLAGGAEGGQGEVRQTFGIAQFIAADAPRTFQRGSRPYAHTIRIGPDEVVEQRYFRLIVSGRVSDYGDGQPIHCRNDSADLPPICLMAVDLTRVAFEGQPKGNILAEWRK